MEWGKFCMNCGKELRQLPQKKKKVFCNSTCRSNYWQKSDRLEKAGKSIEEIVNILSKIAKNNQPKNKNRIEKERNTIANHSNYNNPLPTEDVQKQIADYEEELKHLGTSSIAIQRKKFVWDKIYELKNKLTAKD